MGNTFMTQCEVKRKPFRLKNCQLSSASHTSLAVTAMFSFSALWSTQCTACKVITKSHPGVL
jgi:hypothetical protein